jgi:hypothetical protein
MNRKAWTLPSTAKRLITLKLREGGRVSVKQGAEAEHP